MVFIRERRDDRFVDFKDSFKKLPSNGYDHTFIYKHVKKLVSVKFSQILQLLQEELCTNTIYRNIWNTARAKYSNSNNNSTTSTPSSLPRECYIALIAYTMEGPLYNDFNAKLRLLKNASDWKNFNYKSLYALLARSIHGIDNNPSVTPRYFYRAMSCRPEVLNFEVGDCIYPTQFLSCSVNKEVAVRFMGDEQATLITFHGGPLAACGIANHSVHPEEEEILVFPWSTFKVTKIHRSASEDAISLRSVDCLVDDLPYSGKYTREGINIINQ
jgi:hypothetical protein